MSKELEALQDLSKLVFIYGGVEQYKIIETGLERLNDLRQMLYKMNVKHGYQEYLKIIKALEIIIKKEANVHNFKELIMKQEWTYEQYLDEENDENTSGHQFAYKLLTKEEFDLLKEVLL